MGATIHYGVFSLERAKHIVGSGTGGESIPKTCTTGAFMIGRSLLKNIIRDKIAKAMQL